MPLACCTMFWRHSSIGCLEGRLYPEILIISSVLSAIFCRSLAATAFFILYTGSVSPFRSSSDVMYSTRSAIIYGRTVRIYLKLIHWHFYCHKIDMEHFFGDRGRYQKVLYSI